MKSCQEVTRLLSESMERKLTWLERLSLWFHLSMCRICSGFSKDLQQLRDIARQDAKATEDDEAPAEVTLPVDSRARIKRELENLNS